MAPNYPTSPVASSSRSSIYVFPSDLNQSNNAYNITLNIASYDRPSVFTKPFLNYGTSICLPIPIKINDQTTVLWEQASLTSTSLDILKAGASAIPSGETSALGSAIAGVTGAAVAAGPLLSYAQGIAVNPNLVMLFKTQNFKNHVLQWVLAPNSPQDTENLNNIIKLLKNAMLPSIGGNIAALGLATDILNKLNNAIQSSVGNGFSATLQYPWIVLPNLSVGAYTYNFKPCAIQSLSVDFSPGPSPAFFGQNQAPAMVSLTLQLTEIELWFQGQV